MSDKPVFVPVTPEQRKALKVEILASSARTKARQRHQSRDDAKALAIATAYNQWSETPTARYGEIVPKVQAILKNDGYNYSDDTVEGWIKPCAPPEAKAPGRPRIHPQIR